MYARISGRFGGPVKPRESWSDTNLCYSNIFTLVSICLMFAGFRPRTVVIIPYPWTSIKFKAFPVGSHMLEMAATRGLISVIES